ncbi:hypothetical protein [Campylobacter lari]|uniref:hypothetical protein n=1 Tax=Campylobacter lari TaxID=201 RepID=UPI00127C486F|nr:hypothetical protein [Campylobacter lari]
MTEDEKRLLKLANLNKNGYSEWINREQIKKAGIKIGNGFPSTRKTSYLNKTYVIVKDTSITKGNSIDRVKFEGFKNDSN